MTPDAPDILTLAEAAELMRVSESTLYKRVQCGDVPAIKCGGWRISKTALLEWVAAGMPEREQAAPVAVVRAVAGKRGRA